MRVAFLVDELGRSGGIGVVLGWARGLAERDGFDPEIVICGPKAAPAPDLGELPVRALPAAREAGYDVAVATWWTTVGALAELRTRRRAALLLNIEHRFYRPTDVADLTAAVAVLGQPVDFICIAAFMRDLLADLRPDARSFLVRPGIDKDVFRPVERPRRDGPLRVLVEGQPTLWFKQVTEALAAVRGMAAEAAVTVVAQDPGDAARLGADRTVGGLDAAAMARLYAEHDVQLKLPRFEGLGLPPIEGFHTGLPCITTPFTGHEEFMEHGGNGLVVGFDDQAATSAALDLLARDEGLLEGLSQGALATAARWPGKEASLDALADALGRIAAEPPPTPDPVHAQRLERLRTELVREAGRPLAGALAWKERELEEAHGWNRKLQHDLDVVQASRAYRMALQLRRLVPKRPRT